MENATLSAAALRPGRACPSNWLVQTKLKPVERVQITFEDAGSGLLRFQAKIAWLEVIAAEQVWRSGRDLYDNSTPCCTVILQSKVCLPPRCLANKWASARQCRGPDTNHGFNYLTWLILPPCTHPVNSLVSTPVSGPISTCSWAGCLDGPQTLSCLMASGWSTKPVTVLDLPVTALCQGWHCLCCDHPQLPDCPPSWSSSILTAERVLKYDIPSLHMGN